MGLLSGMTKCRGDGRIITMICTEPLVIMCLEAYALWKGMHLLENCGKKLLSCSGQWNGCGTLWRFKVKHTMTHQAGLTGPWELCWRVIRKGWRHCCLCLTTAQGFTHAFTAVQRERERERKRERRRQRQRGRGRGKRPLLEHTDKRTRHPSLHVNHTSSAPLGATREWS